MKIYVLVMCTALMHSRNYKITSKQEIHKITKKSELKFHVNISRLFDNLNKPYACIQMLSWMVINVDITYINTVSLR